MADIVWNTTKLPDAIVGVPYEASLAVHANATAITAGTATGLPGSGNLVVNADHLRITGTPKKADVGTYTVAVTLTDTAGGQVSGSLNLVVRYSGPVDAPGLATQSAATLVAADYARQWPA